jgi:HSP20 family protein
LKKLKQRRKKMFGLQMINEMERFQRDMNQFFGGFGRGILPEVSSAARDIKIRNIEGGYQLIAALPGIDVNKLEIDVLGRRLTLSAEQVDSDAEAGVVWHRRERQREIFKRSLTLPEEIDTEKVAAEYNKGILTITLPKAASALPKKISVKVG